MDLDTYQHYALKTWRDDLSQRDSIINATMGLAGETGELVDLIKKAIFHGHQIDVAKVEKELGDVIWYCAVLAHEYGLRLGTVADTNVRKLAKRYPEGFSEEASRNRSE